MKIRTLIPFLELLTVFFAIMATMMQKPEWAFGLLLFGIILHRVGKR